MNKNRSIILEMIKENRNILFGKYSETLTHQKKKDAWVSIYNKGCDMGILDPTRGWSYLRDTVWQNWKKSSLKRVKRKKSRFVRKAPSKLEELDKTVLEIVSTVSNDKECAPERLNTVAVADKSINKDRSVVSIPETSMNSFSENTMVSIPSLSGTESRHLESNQNHERDSRHSHETMASELPRTSSLTTKEEVELKILKTKLELLEREAYLKDIEIYNKEKEVGLPSSKFTQKFYSGEIESHIHSESQCKLEID